MALWLVVLIGPLIAIGIIVGLIKAAQALLGSESLLTGLQSRPITALFVVLALLFSIVVVLGFIQLWALTPWGAILALAVVLINGGLGWRWWFRDRDDEDLRFRDRPGESHGGDLAP